MAKEGFVLYKAFWEPISELTNEQLGRLFRAIYEYQITDGEKIEVGADIKMAFSFFINQFRLDNAKYDQMIQARSMAGKRHTGNQYSRSSGQMEQPKQMEQTEQVSQVGTNGTDKDKEKDKEKDKVEKKKSIKKISVKPKYSLDFIGDPVLRGIVHEWLEYKKHRNESYKDQTSVEKMVASLGELSGCDIEKARRIVDQSMANNWAGLFALKDTGQSTEKKDIYMEKARKIMEQ